MCYVKVGATKQTAILKEWFIFMKKKQSFMSKLKKQIVTVTKLKVTGTDQEMAVNGPDVAGIKQESDEN